MIRTSILGVRGLFLVLAILGGAFLAAPRETRADYDEDAVLVAQEAFELSWVAWQNDGYGETRSLHYWAMTYAYNGYFYALCGYYYDEDYFKNAYFLLITATRVNDTLMHFWGGDATFEARWKLEDAALYCMWAYFD